MSDNLKLGQLIEGEQQRDAVHVAVSPAIAGVKLYPGQHVSLLDGVAAPTGTPIGIVDPFLLMPVEAEKQFWLFLYPGSITSLRHDWTHPAFANPEVPKTALGAKDLSASEMWIRNYAERHCDGLGYDTLMQAAHDYVDHGDYLSQGGRFEGMYIDDEFWTHFAAITGKTCNGGSFFSCSC